MSVLLIGRDSDLHLDAVLVELKRRNVKTIRINPERLDALNTKIVRSWSEAYTTASIETYAGKIALSEVTGVLCRYALEALVPLSSDALARFRDAEFWAAIRGLLLEIDGSRWINDPFQEARADHKILQLSLAKGVGLLIPPTLVSQEKNEIVSFNNMYGQCVIKALSDVGLTHKDGKYLNELTPKEGDAEIKCSFSNRFNETFIETECVDFSCPVLLQMEVKKHSDVRITVVDDTVFAAEMFQETNDHQVLDVRNANVTVVSQFDVDESVALALCSLIQKLGLRFASCDFARTEEKLYFLEANVSGNWLWTEIRCGLPISSAIADALIKGNERL